VGYNFCECGSFSGEWGRVIYPIFVTCLLKIVGENRSDLGGIKFSYVDHVRY